ncbi:hypothetical protein Y032_0245g3560 [Ancylostoma ceylanicum]|uniref:Uncharacterized protein n=1 Tax=Ancylostoma ceylanicum TaxID=53326 RepID=A0A016SD21_9BILA|nr:hypothetical protein Y032_0245g3560 [Ancylostoma ceylanicum]
MKSFCTPTPLITGLSGNQIHLKLGSCVRSLRPRLLQIVEQRSRGLQERMGRGISSAQHQNCIFGRRSGRRA